MHPLSFILILGNYLDPTKSCNRYVHTIRYSTWVRYVVAVCKHEYISLNQTDQSVSQPAKHEFHMRGNMSVNAWMRRRSNRSPGPFTNQSATNIRGRERVSDLSGSSGGNAPSTPYGRFLPIILYCTEVVAPYSAGACGYNSNEKLSSR